MIIGIGDLLPKGEPLALLSGQCRIIGLSATGSVFSRFRLSSHLHHGLLPVFAQFVSLFP